MPTKVARTLLLAALFAVPAVTGWLARETRTPWAGGGKSVFFEVEKGRGAKAVARELGANGIIRSPLALTAAYDLYYSREKLKAGEYEFTFPLSARDALFIIVSGKVYLRPLTVPEGLTGSEIGALLESARVADPASFRAAFLDTSTVADLDREAHDLEGYLFPDTYHVPRKETAGGMVGLMTAGFRKAFGEDWRRRAAALGMSIRQVVTLASLIEEETGRPEERPLVSAVFHNRLRLGMKLDCDPTIIYALKKEGRYDGRLLIRDLKYPSPYNTYLHAGLPPGPISNPGRASIEAALYPADEGYLYFVAQGDGSHRFSRTLAEHLAAVERYRLKKN